MTLTDGTPVQFTVLPPLRAPHLGSSWTAPQLPVDRVLDKTRKLADARGRSRRSAAVG